MTGKFAINNDDVSKVISVTTNVIFNFTFLWLKIAFHSPGIENLRISFLIFRFRFIIFVMAEKTCEKWIYQWFYSQ